ncbi:MAG: glutaredoxin [Myxococcales bacterium]|nr:glutaredoxin [Myxococcales bacterium]
MASPASSPVRIFRTRVCPYCVMAARFFDRKGVAYEEIYLDGKHDERKALEAQTNWRTVPQIFVGDTFVGGYMDVATLDRSGKLDKLLAEVSG